MKKTKMLKKNYEFRKVLSKGKYYSGKYVEAFILENNKSQNYLGIAVSTKIGTAVKRNRIKRLFREGYYFFEDRIIDGIEIVLLWKKKQPADNANFYSIKHDINTICDKAGILKEKNYE